MLDLRQSSALDDVCKHLLAYKCMPTSLKFSTTSLKSRDICRLPQSHANLNHHCEPHLLIKFLCDTSIQSDHNHDTLKYLVHFSPFCNNLPVTCLPFTSLETELFSIIFKLSLKLLPPL